MKLMALRQIMLLSAFVPISANCSSPPDRYQGAVVHSRGALPCFGINDTDEARTTPPEIAGVRVTERNAGGTFLVWEVSYVEPAGSGPRLRPGDCIAFGEGGSAAPRLKAGSRYRVAILGDMERRDGQAEVRWYTAYFCMMEKGGSLEPLQVEWDGRRDEWAWSACGMAEGTES